MAGVLRRYVIEKQGPASRTARRTVTVSDAHTIAFSRQSCMSSENSTPSRSDGSPQVSERPRTKFVRRCKSMARECRGRPGPADIKIRQQLNLAARHLRLNLSLRVTVTKYSCTLEGTSRQCPHDGVPPSAQARAAASPALPGDRRKSEHWSRRSTSAHGSFPGRNASPANGPGREALELGHAALRIVPPASLVDIRGP